MPSVTVKNKTTRQGGRAANAAQGPSQFSETLQQGFASGTNPFANLSPEQLSAMATSPAYQSNAWLSPAQGEVMRLVNQAVLALRRGTADRESLAARAFNAANLIGSVGKTSPEIDSAVGMLSQLRAPGNALVPTSGYGGSGALALIPDNSKIVRLTEKLVEQTYPDTVGRAVARNITAPGVRERASWIEGAFTEVPFGGGGGGDYGGIGGYAHGFRSDAASKKKKGREPVPGEWFQLGPEIPGASMVGGGGISRILTGALGLAGPYGRIAAAVLTAAEEAFFPTQAWGAQNAATLGRAQGFITPQAQAYALARAGGWSGGQGKALMDVVHQPSGVPAWMSLAGWSSQNALDALKNFGVVPHNVGQATELMQSLSKVPFIPGLSGLNSDASIAQAARLGLIGPNSNSVENFTMTQGVLLDRLRTQDIAREPFRQAVDASIDASAQISAGGLDWEGTAGYISRWAGSPGGRSGAMGASVITAQREALDTYGKDPFRTMMIAQASTQINSEADLIRYLGVGGREADVAAYMKTTEGKNLSTDFFLSKKHGNIPLAGQKLDAMAQGYPQAAANMLYPEEQFKGYPLEVQHSIEAKNRNISENKRAAEEVRGLTTIPGTAQGVIDVDHMGGRWTPGGSAGFQKGIAALGNDALRTQTAVLEGQLYAMGVHDPQARQELIGAGILSNVDPLRMGAIYMRETLGPNDISTGGAGKIPANQNPLQVTQTATDELNRMHPDAHLKYIAQYPVEERAHQSYLQGTAYYDLMLQRTGGNTHASNALYGPPPGYPGGNTYADAVDNFYKRVTGGVGDSGGISGGEANNIPGGTNADIAQANRAILSGAQDAAGSLHNLATSGRTLDGVLSWISARINELPRGGPASNARAKAGDAYLGPLKIGPNPPP